MDAGSIPGVRIEPQAPSRQAFITTPGYGAVDADIFPWNAHAHGRSYYTESKFGLVSGTGYSLTVEIRHFKSERKENCFDSWLMERSRSGKSATLKFWADGNPLR
jgi:hypothetical protein